MDEQLQACWQENLTDLTNFFNSERFFGKKRHYTPADIAPLRNSFKVNYPSTVMSDKLNNMLRTCFNNNSFELTYGALDPVQVINLSKYLKCVYVSGWQCSSTASVTNEPGPDFADYPVNTVPSKVDQLFKAQLFHDRKQNEMLSRLSPKQLQETKIFDYMAPMLADADTGFGGTTAIMKLTKLFIESGAAGIHIEDQRLGTKKCGHMAGKVIVPTKIHCNRLIAARLQADICGSGLVVCARTDALGAKFIESNIDELDHPFILGINNPQKPTELVTFIKAGEIEIAKRFSGKEKDVKLQKWLSLGYECSLTEAKKLAKTLDFDFYFDWEATRTYEGFYLIEQNNINFCIRRAREYSNYADLIWMETETPSIAVARQFAEGVHAYNRTQMLAYNLSPSFNWDKSGMTDSQLENFSVELGKCGYVFQFITLAGFHMDALISEKFTKSFAKEGILAYVRDIQRKERVHNVDQLKHQKWSGSEYSDKLMSLGTLEISTLSEGKDSTENQF